MALTKAHVQNVCMAHCGAKQCRYLEPTDYGASFNCLKLTGAKASIDLKTQEFVDTMKKSGMDPTAQGHPLGNGGSCPGYPYLKHIKQGYDVNMKKS